MTYSSHTVKAVRCGAAGCVNNKVRGNKSRADGLSLIGPISERDFAVSFSPHTNRLPPPCHSSEALVRALGPGCSAPQGLCSIPERPEGEDSESPAACSPVRLLHSSGVGLVRHGAQSPARRETAEVSASGSPHQRRRVRELQGDGAAADSSRNGSGPRYWSAPGRHHCFQVVGPETRTKRTRVARLSEQDAQTHGNRHIARTEGGVWQMLDVAESQRIHPQQEMRRPLYQRGRQSLLATCTAQVEETRQRGFPLPRHPSALCHEMPVVGVRPSSARAYLVGHDAARLPARCRTRAAVEVSHDTHQRQRQVRHLRGLFQLRTSVCAAPRKERLSYCRSATTAGLVQEQGRILDNRDSRATCRQSCGAPRVSRRSGLGRYKGSDPTCSVPFGTAPQGRYPRDSESDMSFRMAPFNRQRANPVGSNPDYWTTPHSRCWEPEQILPGHADHC
jgi:hypothetical protein